MTFPWLENFIYLTHYRNVVASMHAVPSVWVYLHICPIQPRDIFFLI